MSGGTERTTGHAAHTIHDDRRSRARLIRAAALAGAAGLSLGAGNVAAAGSLHAPLPAPVVTAASTPLAPATALAPSRRSRDTAASAPAPWRVLAVRPGDTLSRLFARAGLGPRDVAAVMALGGRTRALAALHPGDALHLRVGAHRRLLALRYALDGLDTLVVTARDGRLASRVVHVNPVRRPAFATGTVHTALALAMRHAGVPSAVIAQFVQALHWKVDFRRDMRAGARFSVVYEKLYRGRHEIGTGEVLAAGLDIRHRRLRLFRYRDGHGGTRFFTRDGHSIEPSLLRTPVHYTHVSSRFSLHRYEPVLHVWRPHWGVDLAAPIGTPVEAAGDGRVTFVGRESGYGNIVTIRHFGTYSTRYAHLRRFARGLHAGSWVRQGQIIGYVGESGEATGPHLHFEIRKHGRAHDPLTMRLPDASPLPHRLLPAFHASIAPLRAALDSENRTAAARALASVESGRAAEAGGSADASSASWLDETPSSDEVTASTDETATPIADARTGRSGL